MNIEQGIMKVVKMSASQEGCQAEALEAGLEVEIAFLFIGQDNEEISLRTRVTKPTDYCHPSRTSRQEPGRQDDKGALTIVTLRLLNFEPRCIMERSAPLQNDVGLALEAALRQAQDDSHHFRNQGDKIDRLLSPFKSLPPGAGGWMTEGL
jgi:hypothetical protein